MASDVLERVTQTAKMKYITLLFNNDVFAALELLNWMHSVLSTISWRVGIFCLPGDFGTAEMLEPFV